jgi:hypothetical protein
VIKSVKNRKKQMKIKTALLLVSTTFLLSGCFQDETPKCSDSDVKDLIKEIYQDSLQELSANPMSALFIGGLPKKIVSISSVRPVAYDKTVHLRTCKAEAKFDNNQTTDIEYTVQITEDNPDEFYVELDTSFMEGLVQSSMMQEMLGDK